MRAATLSPSGNCVLMNMPIFMVAYTSPALRAGEVEVRRIEGEGREARSVRYAPHPRVLRTLDLSRVAGEVYTGYAWAARIWEGPVKLGIMINTQFPEGNPGPGAHPRAG